MYADRIRYPEEHEVEGSGQDLPRHIMSPLIFIRDTAKQFLMSVQHGRGLWMMHWRCTTPQAWVQKSFYAETTLGACAGRWDTNTQHYNWDDGAVSPTKQLETWLVTRATTSTRTWCSKKYTPLVNAVISLEEPLGNIVTKYRPLEIQTSDAGPGVGTSEKATCLRLVENFLIHD